MNNTIIENKPILLVSASANSTFYPSFFHDKFKNVKFNYEGAVYDFEYKTFSNNKKGLSELYNLFLTPEYKNHIVVFVHDDVIIEDAFLFEKLYSSHEKFDLVGLAGCIDPKIKSPAYWHLMADRRNLRGFVNHNLNNKIIMSVFGETRSQVDMIDGVFMSVNVSKFLEKNVKFDENFTFDFYDLSFSLRAKKAGLTIGVWSIFITHFSGGGGASTFKESEKRFLELYG